MNAQKLVHTRQRKAPLRGARRTDARLGPKTGVLGPKTQQNGVLGPKLFSPAARSKGLRPVEMTSSPESTTLTVTIHTVSFGPAKMIFDYMDYPHLPHALPALPMISSDDIWSE